MNQQLYVQLTQAAFVLANKMKNEREIITLQNSLYERKKKIEDLKKKIAIKPVKTSDGGCFFISVAVLVFLISVTMFINYFVMGNDYLITIGSLLLTVSLILWFIGGLLNGNAELHSQEKADAMAEELRILEKEDAKFEEEVNSKIEKIQKLNGECWDTGKHFLEFLPQKYRTSQAIAFMGEAVKNLRADTLKEAINLYEDKMDRDIKWELEMEEIQEQSKVQREHMREMERLAEESAGTQKRIEDDLEKIKEMQYYDMMNKEQ